VPKYDAAFIGAGISGLYAAALLAKAGKKVIVVDPGEGAGGAAAERVIDRFRFSAGPNIGYGFEAGSPAQAFFTGLGLSPDQIPAASRFQVALPDRRITVSPNVHEMLAELRNKNFELPLIIGGKEIRSGKLERLFPPHEIAHTLGYYHQGDASHVKLAIEAAMAAKKQWEALSWHHRASVFLKAADLLAGPFRAKINAATMLGQSKNAYQSEIDAACELADFFRFFSWFCLPWGCLPKIYRNTWI